MKTKINLIILLSVLIASCSSLQQTTVNDDIYFSPEDQLMATNDEPEKAKPVEQKTTLFEKEYEDKIQDILDDDLVTDTLIYENTESENPYDRLIVDSYSEAYERRIEAMNSPYYGMRSYSILFSDDYWYAQSFFNDPFYNVVIVGDRIWVEPYWMASSFAYRPSWNYSSFGYYNSYYYNPYYYSYYGSSYYGWNSHYPYYYNDFHNHNHHNDNWAGSFSSNRRRGLATSSSSRAAYGSRTRELPEAHSGRDVRSASTVKSGLDRTTRTGRSGDALSNRTGSGNIARESIRVRETNGNRTATATRSTGTRSSATTASSTNRTDVRSQRTTRSTYNSSNRSATTRYSRPNSTSVQSGNSSRTSRTSTYSPARSNTSRSGSSYTPRSSGSSSSGNSSGSSVRSSSSGSSNSGTRSSSSGSSSRSSSSSSSGRKR